jgi:hypothetical protein
MAMRDKTVRDARLLRRSALSLPLKLLVGMVIAQ